MPVEQRQIDGIDVYNFPADLLGHPLLAWMGEDYVRFIAAELLRRFQQQDAGTEMKREHHYIFRSLPMRMNAMLAIGVAASVWAATRAEEKKEPLAPQSPELKVLERFVGTWEVETKVVTSEGKPKDVQLKGVATVEWILGGRFLEFRIRSKPGPLEDLQLTTYDAAKKTYRHWYFSSEGVADESTGKWDEEGNTMTWKADFDDGKTLVNTIRFTDRDTQAWKLVVKDRANKVVTEMQGKMTRRK
jgi:Protein of unknown function (DUF1579)